MTDRANTLIILTPGFAESEADTACLPFLQLFVKALNRNYPHLKVIILAFQYPFHKQHYTWYGNEVIAFNGRNIGKLKRLQVWYRAWKTLDKLRKQHHVNGLFSLWVTECALIGKRFGDRHGIEHYTWICGQDAKTENRRYVDLIKPYANDLIAMSDFLQMEFNNNYGILPQWVIPQGIAPASYPQPPAERDIDIIGVGSLIPLKQYDIFIRLIKDISITKPGIIAIIRGSGPEEKKLKALIKELQLENNISIVAELPYEEVLALMQRAKLMLHTANYEGFGTACLEALGAGAHVISFTRPMESPIPHWQHATNYDEMLIMANSLLADKNLEHDPVFPYTVDDISKEIIGLYGV